MLKDRGRNFIAALILFLFILSLSITITINFTPLYHFFVLKDDLGSLVGLSNQELMKEYYRLLSFLNYPWVNSLNLTLPSSADGIHHFFDVKHLFFVNYCVLLLTVVPSFLIVKKMKAEKSQWKLIVPAKLTMLVLFVLVMIMVLNFNKFFIIFHEVLFRNSDWLFDPKLDPIINALPDTFFMACFIFFFCLIELFLWIGVIYGKRSLR
ncbi:TIGR01906 family membrane protein [Liquorilactobacillus mali]|uniref:Intergral membrane protein n=1 Tax=Liquorilactobacillus mali TaxID=1618 RepID=A0A0R2FE08_9LACO|nr:TIGR01906 family membrane protein [Liquorilactobacillus mali]KRN26849.1 intergral membrane protein [Liquorilactobacillus mali]MDN7146527.1 TIGR01906 family membrane protein [Liquorilactobacillus mali]